MGSDRRQIRARFERLFPILRARGRYVESGWNVGFAGGSGKRAAGAPAGGGMRGSRRDGCARTDVFRGACGAARGECRIAGIGGGDLCAREGAIGFLQSAARSEVLHRAAENGDGKNSALPAARKEIYLEDSSAEVARRFWFSGGIEVGVVRSGDGADFGESLLAQQFAVFEDGFKSIAGRGRFPIQDFDGGELLAILDEIEAAALASFGRIGFRIFVNVVPFAVAVY